MMLEKDESAQYGLELTGDYLNRYVFLDWNSYYDVVTPLFCSYHPKIEIYPGITT